MKTPFQNKMLTFMSWLLLAVMGFVFLLWGAILIPIVLSGLAIIFFALFIISWIARGIVLLTNRFSSRSP